MSENVRPELTEDGSLKSKTEVTSECSSPEIPTPAQTLEQELAEIDAAIDEAWDLLEPSFRYLADR